MVWPWLQHGVKVTDSFVHPRYIAHPRPRLDASCGRVLSWVVDTAYGENDSTACTARVLHAVTCCRHVLQHSAIWGDTLLGNVKESFFGTFTRLETAPEAPRVILFLIWFLLLNMLFYFLQYFVLTNNFRTVILINFYITKFYTCSMWIIVK